MEINFLLTDKLDLTYFPICRMVKDGRHKGKFIQICYTKFSDEFANDLIHNHSTRKKDGSIIFPNITELYDYLNKFADKCFDVLKEKMNVEYCDYDKDKVINDFIEKLFEIYGT